VSRSAPPLPAPAGPSATSSRGAELFSALARAILLATGMVALVWFLWSVTWVLLFFALATILALALNAPVTWLERRRVPRLAAAVAVFAALLVLLSAIGWLIVPSLLGEVSALADLIPVFAMNLADRIAALLAQNPELERQFRVDVQTATQFVPWALDALGNLWRYGLSLVVALILGLVLFAVVLYMVVDPRPLLAGYVAALPPRHRAAGVRAFTRASRMVVGWVYASAIISAMKAIPAFFFLSWIGLPGALVWSVFTFVADIVPRLGFYLMIVPPTLVALSIDVRMALWVVLFYWAISEILGNLVAPRIQATTMEMHPVFLLFVTLAMVAAFGVLGAIIASPVAGFVKAYYEEFYLARLPTHPDLDRDVETMLARGMSPDTEPPEPPATTPPGAPG
jgi:putative permease